MPDRAYLHPIDPELMPVARNTIEICVRLKPQERITIITETATRACRATDFLPANHADRKQKETKNQNECSEIVVSSLASLAPVQEIQGATGLQADENGRLEKAPASRSFVATGEKKLCRLDRNIVR